MRLKFSHKNVWQRLLLIGATTLIIPLFFSWFLLYVGVAGLEASHLIGNETVFVLTSSYILPLGFYFYFPFPLLIPLAIALVFLLFLHDIEKLFRYCAASVFIWLLTPGLVAGIILGVSVLVA